ncbi:MAG: PAS domain S-box protein [Oscillibacter sp.]|uniref:PAS domain S-box protein n=1 Tax=Oscillibacter sp. TaxID=1945593 RepID=UPI001321DB52|nr:PAS domain S-box protein [Oscillibacter sp.]
MVEFSIQTARSLLDFVVHRAENDQLIHAVMNYTQEGLIITDRDGIISQLNASAERIIGTVNEEACGQNADQLLANRHIVDSLTNESGLADPRPSGRFAAQHDPTGWKICWHITLHSRHGGYSDAGTLCQTHS